ncbi:M20/M25/M40 family metallo-hydrolase [Dyella sp.]|jgi:acetylornithine deacetylase/succinyl-diaminopimelate desuccinylase-like protein|uniref:M20/M25/M40 family metallo-hydrolase n=1 Tax=Dyella sp. TaxID=1869338 RepID=UPI002D7961B9|nr:M20/M25/M40 family metallo-hydrolase [Dyella sp.]HET6431450.1 M20/M25/M40 family metallo-hydrolase [Dyella sp.]
MNTAHALRHALIAAACCITPGLTAAASPSAQDLPQTMTMLRHAIGVPTVAGRHQVPVLAAYFADQLKAGGIPASDIEIIPVGETAALAARYRGTGEGKPILLSGHMDVVAAKRADWTRDPFSLVEEDGYLYGRGTADMKTAAVVLVQTLIRLKREGFKPKHDLILLLSGDEETTMASTRELARRFHDAEFLLNADAGGGTLDPASGKPVVYQIQAAEKTYADFRITLTSPGGHSSEPTADNAIYRLAKVIDRVAGYAFPPMINDITRASLRATGAHTPGALGKAMTRFADHPDDAAAAATISADPAYVGQIRTTCVATMLDGGHALNALPQSASVNVNCRIFPGTPVAAVRDTLVKVIDDRSATVSVLPPPPVESPASPLREDVIAAVTDAVHARFPDVEIAPGMSAGASDSMYFRNAGVPSYGVDAAFTKPDDTFAHGLNEKLPASEVEAGLAFWHRVLTQLAR